MFTGFLFHLRGFGLKVSMMEWLSLMRGLSTGFSRSNLTVFYHLSRALLVKKEADFDTFDRAFAKWCFTVECDRPRRWAAAFSDPATRTAATTPTSRSGARSAGRDDRRVMRSAASRTAPAARPAAS